MKMQAESPNNTDGFMSRSDPGCDMRNPHIAGYYTDWRPAVKAEAKGAGVTGRQG
jgi:hypothetical protein